MKRRVVITGLGVISSIGIGWRDFWKNLLEGKSGISPVESFDTSNYPTHNGGEVKIFKPEEFISQERLVFLNRTSQMAIAASLLAIRDAGLIGEINKYRITVSFGTTLGDAQTIEPIDNDLLKATSISKYLCYQISTHSAPSNIAKVLNLQKPIFMFSTACAAGNYAIGYGYDMIMLDKTDIVIAGACDAMSRIEFTGFNQFNAVAPDKCQPFDKNRKGMMLAEGSGVLVLESLEMAIKRKAKIYGEIIGYGLSCDAHHMTTPTVEGIAACMRKAMKEANISINDVDYICAHGTGTLMNDKNECAAIREVFGPRYKEIPVSSIKSMLGHTMGAASALEAVACALVVQNDIIPPTINYETPDPECDIDCVPNKARHHRVNIALNNSFAFGGNNACLVIKKYIN
ncbi:MAG: beta-ketoacyl-[acyl-carrier-protein] synthase family protein [Thermodesulfovibrionales bacterium]|nr:beta-ketoacyl-[acyl-carrier-protein] synthase family protein [Thermodesulfovibrionales bacterium]